MHIDPADYAIEGIDSVITPALAIYPAFVDANIDATLRLAGGDANRWRPHIKTAKLGFTMRRLVERGVVNFKCSTSLELLASCRNGARDVVVAYPMVGANADRVREIAAQYPGVRVSILVENEAQATAWAGTRYLRIHRRESRHGSYRHRPEPDRGYRGARQAARRVVPRPALL